MDRKKPLQNTLAEKTKRELKGLCRHYRIKGYSRKKNAELVALLMER